MATQELFKKLTAPFKPEEIDWRIQNGGIKNREPWALITSYVDARAVQNRLDEVIGPENWQVSYTPQPSGFLCSLSIKLVDVWVSKEDGAEHTDIEPFKGGISKALVRAASCWGIGRYLYDTPTTYATFVEKGVSGARHSKIDHQDFYWLPPQLAATSSPRPIQQAASVEQKGNGNSHSTLGAEAPTSPLGETVIPFGKFSKPRPLKFSEIPIQELSKWSNHMKSLAIETKKPLTGHAARIIPMVDQYLEQISGQENFPLEEAPF